MLAVTVTVALALYAIEEEPLVRQNAPVDYETLAAGMALLKRIVRQFESADDRGTTLAITEGEFQMGAEIAYYLHPTHSRR